MFIGSCVSVLSFILNIGLKNTLVRQCNITKNPPEDYSRSAIIATSKHCTFYVFACIALAIILKLQNSYLFVLFAISTVFECLYKCLKLKYLIKRNFDSLFVLECLLSGARLFVFVCVQIFITKDLLGIILIFLIPNALFTHILYFLSWKEIRTSSRKIELDNRKYFMVNNISEQISRQIDTWIIYNFLTINELAFFNRAKNLLMMLSSQINNLFGNALLLSNKKNDGDEFNSEVTKNTIICVIFGLLSYILIDQIGVQVITLIYGLRWTEAGLVFQELAILPAILIFQGLSRGYIISHGWINVWTSLEVGKTIIFLSLFYLFGYSSRISLDLLVDCFLITHSIILTLSFIVIAANYVSKKG